MKKFIFKKGFTLIELLIVITIIGILAVALLPSVLGAPARARDAQRKADLNNIVAALETYNSDNQKYPDTSGCVDKVTGLEKYFQGGTIPKDPNSTVTLFGCVRNYVYCKLTAPNTNYLLASYVEQPGDGNYKSAEATCPTSTAPTIPPAKPTDANAYLIIK